MKSTRSRLCASPLVGHRRPLSVREFCQWQHADNIWNEGKFLPLFTDNRKCCSFTRRHSSYRLKRFWFTFWRFSAKIFEISLRMFSFMSSSVLGLLLATVLSNLISVTTRRLCVFLFIKSPVVLSLFTKLLIVCLLRTLSSRNLRQHFRRHFPADLYFIGVIQK
jgi:hypothetical protein